MRAHIVPKSMNKDACAQSTKCVGNIEISLRSIFYYTHAGQMRIFYKCKWAHLFTKRSTICSHRQFKNGLNNLLFDDRNLFLLCFAWR